jgi:5-deoxy-glucuronate isomerase
MPEAKPGRAGGRPQGRQSAWSPETLTITPESADWAFCGLRILELGPGESFRTATGEDELIVLPLSGNAAVTVDGQGFTLAGRESVFAALTDFVYAPRDAELELVSEAGGRFALPAARAAHAGTARHVPAAEVPVELRGAGQASRQVNNFAAPDVFAADRLIAVEVLTPAGNWSSYPPHKHDKEIPGVETALEEIYYFEVADGGFAYQRAYGPGLDICCEVRSGDTVLLPHGYHGPSMAAPGYDLYYLNVMAGPGERAWRFQDDPAHAWIRDTWADQEIDPRLPMTGEQ